MDAALHALADVEASLPGLRAETAAVADATTWQAVAVRRFHRALQTWDDDIATLTARVAGECDDLRAARARWVALHTAAG